MKKRRGIVFTVMLALIMLFALPVGAQAAGKNLKKSGVPFDLKPNQAVSCQAYFADVGLKKETAKLTDFKITDAKKSGYKQLKFTVTFQRNHSWTKSEVHKAANSKHCQKTGSILGSCYYALVDYNTGACLAAKNKYDVTVKASDWETLNEKTYTDAHGCYVTIRDIRRTVTVTYPASYKGLCLGVGGETRMESAATKKFWKGKLSFKKTELCKDAKKYAAFMRVTK